MTDDKTADTDAGIVAAMIETVWRRGELAALPRFWTEDYINHAAPPESRSGLEALRRYHEGFAAAFAGLTDWQIAIVQQIARDGRVATHLRTTARHTGTFMGLAATDRTATFSSMRIDRLEDGKIAEHWSVGDLAGLLEQLRA